MVRRDGAWRGGRRGRGLVVGYGAVGGPRPHFAAAAGNINIHPQQQQGFGGPHFGVDGFVRPPGHPGTRGGIHSRSQLSQQQSPHKILINPHFRGAVQPHPEGKTCYFNIFLSSSVFTLHVIPSFSVLSIPCFSQSISPTILYCPKNTG